MEGFMTQRLNLNINKKNSALNNNTDGQQLQTSRSSSQKYQVRYNEVKRKVNELMIDPIAFSQYKQYISNMLNLIF